MRQDQHQDRLKTIFQVPRFFTSSCCHQMAWKS